MTSHELQRCILGSTCVKLCCEVAILEHTMASVVMSDVNHANSNDLRYGNSELPGHLTFLLQEDDFRRTQLSARATNGRSGLILHEEIKPYGGSHHSGYIRQKRAWLESLHC